ncbi:hypothetical protein KY345_04840 [Candidatus Woesearchaeota archaeon]|nr:hypothetical protein [Candidatus Woesearchaeota archaeon]
MKLKKTIKWLCRLLLNERGGGGGGDTTTIVEQPAPTDEERELQKQELELSRLRLEEAKKQSELWGQFAPMYEKQMTQQAVLAKQQIEAQQTAMGELTKAMQPTEQELLNQQIEGELLGRQQSYLAGEMPELSMEEQLNLDKLTGTYKEQALEDIMREGKLGMTAAKNVAFARGGRSSSIRERAEDKVRAGMIGAAGAAERQIEGTRFQAAWQMPRAKQIFETGQSQFQQALNQQANINRQQLFGALSPGYQNPFQPIGSMMDMSIPGTYFGGKNTPDRPNNSPLDKILTPF